ncbi:WecB/TagA/CpsF family glycosyltransferase [Streptomyces afghaniensis]|uniref:WecB/TagA/CpsF family glycosyltransferase n=1 Tax=Streptomyces afghaniensis TaxID=66865 RepID=UPI00277FB39B|nr:WecB/TagA/CpsF family glycosyltransferase [Streptomyces afghaniensis]MDQ1020524.1 N-acetylglucosaminyldiphosphoundecaprenol N-acetyl-beta-D-mannosaminyltransferase [Streptomyces afghaniensis]
MAEGPGRPVTVCGLPVHPLTLQASVTAAEALIATGGPHQHVVLNAAKVVKAHDDPELARIIRSCSLVNADGQSVVWAGRLLGSPLPERVAGIDFMLALWSSAARNRYRVYLLGAEPEVVAETARIAAARGVEVVGHRDGYWDDSEEEGVVAAVRATRPDILFLAVPSPRKEYFLARRHNDLGCALVVGVGGSFDVVAGLRSRAPRWMRRAGLEWFHRMVQEPRRMFLRYAVGNARFIALTAAHWTRRGERNGTGRPTRPRR